MPELPEIETIRLSLLPVVSNLVIKDVEIHKPEVLLNNYDLPLKGWMISGLRRRGKYLLFDLEAAAGYTQPIPAALMMIHLRMTGQLFLALAEAEAKNHVHVKFHLENPKTQEKVLLLFRDVRRFGRIEYFPAGLETSRKGFATLGPEPLSADWTSTVLADRLKRHSKANIKNVLLNQQVVAGLGNIYVDEALFRAGISPLKMASTLTPEEIDRLVAAVKYILKEAIGHKGTSFSDYVDGLNTKGHFQYELKVYGRGGQKCYVCGESIQKRKIAGRGTSSCPKCQPEA